MSTVKAGKLWRGTLISCAVGGLTYLASIPWDIGEFTPILVAALGTAINGLKVWRAQL